MNIEIRSGNFYYNGDGDTFNVSHNQNTIKNAEGINDAITNLINELNKKEYKKIINNKKDSKLSNQFDLNVDGDIKECKEKPCYKKIKDDEYDMTILEKLFISTFLNKDEGDK